ncbi:TRAP transporter small permease [Desulfococcus multivorans]|nr:TRAP transporter small permease [Desulfococcus multivorans]MDX9819237.1 TRAP transporter small permease [Desulfococcus multivorans]
MPRTTPPRGRIATILDMIRRLEDALLVGLLLAMIVTATFQIVLRNLLGVSIVWGDIMVRVMVLWIGLLGAMIAARKGEHIRIDLLGRLMPGRFQTFVDGAVQLATALLCAAAAVSAFRFVRSEAVFGQTAFARVPAWACEAIIPTAFFVIAIRYLALSIQNLRGGTPAKHP